MTHGYGSDTKWLFHKICICFSTWGYAIFAADLLGHGRSDGFCCYMEMERREHKFPKALKTQRQRSMKIRRRRSLKSIVVSFQRLLPATISVGTSSPI
ncbi:Caffeoylshikimate esterase [Linum grandiflorum]